MENTFSQWMRYNLKDAYGGLITQDVDFVVINKNTLEFCFIEEKNSEYARIGPAQKIIFKMFDDFLRSNSKFLGTHLLIITDASLPPDSIFSKILGRSSQRWDLEQDVVDKLWDCSGNPPTVKTEKERSRYRGSVLEGIFDKAEAKIIIARENLLIEKIDWIFLNYCSGYFIFLEEENRNKRKRPDKEKFIKFIDRIFKEANNAPDKAYNPKSKATYRYLGYFTLSFSNNNPDDSDRILLNGKQIDRASLINLLNLDNDDIIKYS